MYGTNELKKIVADMIDTMDAEPDGVAIAAPQIGVPYRIFVVRYDRMTAPPEGEEPAAKEIGVFVNPSIVRLAKKADVMDEGCLSVRGKYGKTKRRMRATIRAHDVDGKKFERGGGGVLAQAFQHEMDHLEGVLFTDHATNVIDIEKVKEVVGPPDSQLNLTDE
jgi:peptide deformylase